MNIPTLLRGAVKTIDSVTKSLGFQSEVTLHHYTAFEGSGTPTTTITTILPAIVDWKQRQVRTLGGVLTVSRAVVTFTDVAALATATNSEGISETDVIVLPDGTIGPILDLGGFIDAGTKQPIATEVFIG